MKITWKHSFQQVEQFLGVTDRPWIVDPFWELDTSSFLEGKQIRELPFEALVERKLMMNQPSIPDGFTFLLEHFQGGS